ncbi:MAG: pectinesterase family protein, partial [Planctomycetota bacterium]
MAVGVVRGIKALIIVLTLVLIPFFSIQGYSKPVVGHHWPKTIVVDINGSGEYTSIHEAIDNADDGDTIYVLAGVYYENIIINKTITLIGNGSINTIINGSENGDVILIN